MTAIATTTAAVLINRAREAAELAREAYRQALEVRRRLPDEPEYVTRRIRVLLRLGGPADFESADADAEKLVNLHPTHAGYQTLKAHVEFRRQEPDACLRTLEALSGDDLTLRKATPENEKSASHPARPRGCSQTVGSASSLSAAGCR